MELLDRYFSLPDESQHAQAHVDRATAFKTLGRVEDAIACYERALEREVEFPTVETQAYLELPFIIATTGLEERYDQAITLLGRHKQRLERNMPIYFANWPRTSSSDGRGHRHHFARSRGERYGTVSPVSTNVRVTSATL